MYEKVEHVVHNWNQWSPAELAKMDEIVAEYINYAANGVGNHFMRETWKRHFAPAITKLS